MRQTIAVTHATTDLPDDILREIGKTMVLFANLEWGLSRFTYAILGVDRNVGRIAVREPRVSDRFDMVCDLLTYKNATSKADLSAIRKAIVECEEMRNLLAHSTWVRVPVNGTLRIVKTLGQWQPTPYHPRKTKRKTDPEGVKFEKEDAIALNGKLRFVIAAIERWASEFPPPAS